MRFLLFTTLFLLLIGGLVYGLFGLSKTGVPDSEPIQPPEIVWIFEAPDAGGIVAAPTIGELAVYVSAVHVRGFRRSGAVYALDQTTGKPLWTFDDDQAMRPTASAPVLHESRLYFGEGMHADFVCRFYCLDAATGVKQWSFETAGHIESTATFAHGLLYLTAGDDGVYALDPATGQPRWHFAADVHIDSSPCVSGDRLYVGSGPSRRFPACQAICLNALTGEPIWRVPTRLPAWGSPTVHEGRVYFGLGNGRLTEAAKPPETPAGALLCLDPATGRTLWTFSVSDAVFQKPTAHDAALFFGSRNGSLYSLRATDGVERWNVPMKSPIIAPPTIDGQKLYAVSTAGLLKCLDRNDGHEHWSLSMGELVRAEPLVLAAPQVTEGRLYLAAEITTGAGSRATVYCLQRHRRP